jgi:hypothetical protein
MAQSVTTSIVVSFSDVAGSGGVLKAEIDNRPDGFNNGITTFYPGDEPAFLVFKTSDVTISRMEASEGALEGLGAATVHITGESITFANNREASLAYPCTGAITVDKSSPGAPALTLSENQITLTIPINSVCAYLVSYDTVAEGHKISGAAGDMDVVVYIEGATA